MPDTLPELATATAPRTDGMARCLFPCLSCVVALLLACCAPGADAEVLHRLGVRPPLARAEFEQRLPRGWRHELRGFQGRVQMERYHVGAREWYDVGSYPHRILTAQPEDALMKIRHGGL